MKIAVRLLAALTLASVLTGCAMDGHAGPLPGPRICNADRVQQLIGRAATPALVERARRQAGAGTARRITPNMRVTMEFLASRLNVWVGTDGKAERINCG